MLAQGDSLEEEPTREKPVKTNCFYMFFVCPRSRARTKFDRTSSRTPLRPSRATDRLQKPLFSSSASSKWCPESSLGRLWTLLSGSWGALVRSWDALGRSWGALGALLGRSWALLGRFLTPPGDLGSILEPPRINFGASRDRFESLQVSIWSPNPRARQRRERMSVESAWRRLGHA